MTRAKLGREDLENVLEELSSGNPGLKKDDLFVLWFLLAYVTDDERQAAEAVAGGAKDRGVDAVLIDHAARAVHVVQGKYRETIGEKAEKRADVVSFAQLARTLTSEDTRAFKDFLADTEPYTANRLHESRNRLLHNEYRLWLYYVTLGNLTPATQKEARQVAKGAPCEVALQFFSGKRVMVLLKDYLDGVAPPIPTLDLEMEAGTAVKVNGILQRYDWENKIESWVFPMRGDTIAELFERARIRLFARNIRGFLGSTPVNEAMSKTLDEQPDHFFYYNNGITIICDKAEKRSSKGRDFLCVNNPQVINGQQTTRMLATHGENGKRATVLVKVIQVQRQTKDGDEGFDALVSQIVSGTNWQNAIKASDLMSNDRRQIEIERGLRKLKYLYLRKKQSKAEARANSGGKWFLTIRKEELAQAVAGCDLDPVIVRSGKENLFEEDLYDRVFPNTDPNFYLPRYWLMREVTRSSKGYPQRGYAKWLVLRFVWSELVTLVRSAKNARTFRLLCENRDHRLVNPLHYAIEKVFTEAIRYYRENRGKGETVMDISRFFHNKRGRDKEFHVFWNSPENRRRKAFTSHWERVEKAIRTEDL